MDRLRGIEYFVAVAEHGGISRAAETLQVSTAAVSKLLKALEGRLGTQLVIRNSRGVSMTPDGESYLLRCRNVLDELERAEACLSSSRQALRGTLTVGVPPNIGAACLAPSMHEFRAAHPQLKVNLRRAFRGSDIATQGLDVLVALDWLDDDDLVATKLAQTRLVVCAAPSYWAQRAMPSAPRDLARHACLSYRSPEGVVLGQWAFERGGERQVVDVEPGTVCDDQSWLIADALNGGGVVRAVDITVQHLLASGALVPVLLDWEMGEAPPVHLIYRAVQRRNEKVRVFIAFAREVFGRLVEERLPRVKGAPVDASMPDWRHSFDGRRSSRARSAPRWR